ncbi:hypothetical protein J7T55_006911 [Diaporthe amygdali]|uniref:uncharacterized protein n=1 Tax=Phomopsis amygdali TaxID=1214568 RepID=UPI0022FF34AD|nr:uncharacterized protein J7T55_006911 [Diaporthe amygdali]KAJ0107033.1 hypothetical protein J7T55_006911 [Diaporthe amygdali]
MPELVEKDPAVSLPGDQVDASHPPPDRDADNDTIINSVAQEPEIQYPSGIILVLIVGGLLLSMFLVALDMSIISTAIPRITSEFSSMEDIGWYGSAFFLTLASFQSMWGKAYKYYSLRLVFIESIVVFEIGSLLCALAPTSVALIIGRAVQGAGGAGLTGGCYTIAAFLARPAKVPIIIGLLGSTFSLASVVGPLLGGVFSENITWRWCFYINLPIGGVAVLTMLLFCTPEHAKNHLKMGLQDTIINFDLPGLILLLSSLVCFFLALQWGGVSRAWSSGTIVALLVLWVVLTAAWLSIEWFQGEKALVAPRILRKRSIAACCAFIFFLNAANFSLIYNLPIYFQAIAGDSPLISGVKVIPTILSTSLSTAISSSLVGKINHYQSFLLVGAVLVTVGSGLIYTFDINTGLGSIIGYQVLYGVGTGLSVQIPVIVAGATSASTDQAVTISTVLFFQFVSAAYGVGSTDAILNNVILNNVPRYMGGIDGHDVLGVGAGGLETAFEGDLLQGARSAYLDGLHASWAMAIALFGITFLCALAPTGAGRLSPKKVSDDTSN